MYVLIAGAGLVGRGLARRLVENKHDVVVIDIDEEVCNRVYQDYGAVSVNGDATDVDVLEEAGIKQADVAVALMRRDADNLSFSLLSDNFGVPRIFTRMRNQKYEDAYQAAGVTKVVNIVDLYLDQFTLEIEHPKLQRVATFGGGKASIVVVVVPDDSRGAGKTIAEITQDKDFPEDCVIAGIYREDEFIIPRGNRSIETGDRVFLAAALEDIKGATEYLGVSGQKWYDRLMP
ncbi:TrkA family potassium uptake protein [Candidatus Bipolaricaulota bacterium]|nr:TrkA family potassium uptake protein [Candidatus Bipolaricaulota bacterium]